MNITVLLYGQSKTQKNILQVLDLPDIPGKSEIEPIGKGAGLIFRFGETEKGLIREIMDLFIRDDLTDLGNELLTGNKDIFTISVNMPDQKIQKKAQIPFLFKPIRIDRIRPQILCPYG